MAKRISISGGRVIDPGAGLDAVSDVMIADGRIAAVGSSRESSSDGADLIIDAAGMIVCPGFIDLHCHLREPGGESKETIESGTLAAARGGFTTVCAMPNTNPPIDSASMIDFIREKADVEGAVRVLPVGCITKGRVGLEVVDIGAMAAAGAVALSDDGNAVTDSNVMRQALEAAYECGITVVEHCEDESLSAGGVMNEGEIANRLGLKGIPETAEEIIVARDLSLSEMTGGHVHIAHASTYGTVYLLRRARASGFAVTAEVTPHHLMLTEERVASSKSGAGYDTNAKVNPPLRTERDVRALIDGLAEGVINAIATDHAPHTVADKDCDFESAAFGISGLETALGSVMALVHRGDIDLNTLISKLTYEPSMAFPRIRELAGGEVGTLNIGAPADVVIFDPDAEWTVDPAQFASKGKNTPIAGERLKGRVMVTVCGGEIVYKDDGIVVRKA
ncbi:MAG: dihydroorotase [Chloroflexota bacterium]|nr:dihydroorotase [Chloroflexota bacterium]